MTAVPKPVNNHRSLRRRLRDALRSVRRGLVIVFTPVLLALVAWLILAIPDPTAGPLISEPVALTRTNPTLAAPTPKPVCPLSGTPAPHGTVPNHPAVAVKVENSPEGRPQYGLNSADLVYEEPVEGGITRFLAVFQCHSEARIEPVRSSRLVDALILPQLGRPVFGFAGGINPSVNAVDTSGARTVNYITDAAPYTDDPHRLAPHQVETSTSALLAAAGHPTGAPKPLFTYSAKPPTGTPASSVHLDFSYASDVWWRWNPVTGRYLRSYGSTPASLGGGDQISAANVVVEEVPVTPSPYVEDDTGTHQNYVGVIGSGSAEVARDGVVIKGTWVHRKPSDPTELLDAGGKKIPLAPGESWIELFPTTSVANPTP
ncbi:MAG: DUF3048 domain-containing protein [Acidimicrobiales bacterium]